LPKSKKPARRQPSQWKVFQIKSTPARFIGLVHVDDEEAAIDAPTCGRLNARVYQVYKIEDHGGYLIDHLIAVEPGESSEFRNLWPQRFENADKKNKVENQLHATGLRGTNALRQGAIASRL
jgi:hypothetical protein